MLTKHVWRSVINSLRKMEVHNPVGFSIFILDASLEYIACREFALSGAQHRKLWRLIDFDALKNIIFDRFDQNIPGGSQLKPVPLGRFFGGKRAAALL